MRALGVRSISAGPRTATRAHPLGRTRTRREHEVLDLIRAGRGSAEIAGRLVISAKTADHQGLLRFDKTGWLDAGRWGRAGRARGVTRAAAG